VRCGGVLPAEAGGDSGGAKMPSVFPIRILVGVGATVARAAKSATTTIPIVMAVVIDPVEDGLVANLERPGGNMTGLTTFDPQEARKNLELLKEVVPGLTRVALLGDQAVRGDRLTAHEEQARALGLHPKASRSLGPARSWRKPSRP